MPTSKSPKSGSSHTSDRAKPAGKSAGKNASPGPAGASARSPRAGAGKTGSNDNKSSRGSDRSNG